MKRPTPEAEAIQPEKHVKKQQDDLAVLRSAYRRRCRQCFFIFSEKRQSKTSTTLLSSSHFFFFQFHAQLDQGIAGNNKREFIKRGECYNKKTVRIIVAHTNTPLL